MGFRVATVFDISQTDGEPLPERPSGERLRGDAPAEVLAALVRFAHRIDYAVTFEADLLGERNGETDATAQTIKVARGLSAAQTVKTLAHEIGHALMHPAGSAITRSQAEVEAESVAYLVVRQAGIDSAAYSFGYVVSWSGRSERGGVAAAHSGQRPADREDSAADHGRDRGRVRRSFGRLAETGLWPGRRELASPP